MATTEELIVTARWQGQQLEDGAKRTEDGMRKVRRATSEANGEMDKMTQAARTARNALAGLGVAVSAKAVLDYAEGWTKVTNQLRLVSENVERTRAAVVKTALDTHSSLEGTATLYARLTRATQTLGYTEAQRIQLVATINNAMRVSGATATEAAAALIQLSQAFSSGRLAGEEFRAVSEQAPYLLDLLAEALGKTRGEIRQMALDQELTTEIMAEAWLRMSGKVQGEAAKMKLTVGQALEDLKTKLMEFIGASDDAAGGTSTLAAVIKSLADNLWLVQAALLAVGAAWATSGIAAMMKAIGPLLAAGGAGASMTAGGIAGVAVLGTALANKAGNDLYAQYGNTATGAAITGGAFGLQSFRERQIAAEEAAKAGGEWVPVFKEVPKSVYAILEAEKLLHDFRLDAVTTTNDEASELLRLADAQRKQTEALSKSLEGKGVEPETRDRLMRELKVYQDFQTGLVKARQEEEAAAKAQAEAEKALAQARKAAAEQAAMDAATERNIAEGMRRRIESGGKTRRLTAEEAIALDIAAQSRKLNNQQMKDEADQLEAIREAARVFMQTLYGIDDVFRGLTAVYPELSKFQGIVSGGISGVAAAATGNPLGVLASGLNILGETLTLFGGKTEDTAEMTRQAVAKMDEAFRTMQETVHGLATGLGGGAFDDLIQQSVFAPVQQLYRSELARWREMLPGSGEAHEAQVMLAAIQSTLEIAGKAGNGALGEQWALLASVLMGTGDYADIAADALRAMADSIEETTDAADRQIRMQYDLREMMLRQQAASAFQGSGGNLGAQAGIYRTLYGQIEGLAAAERAALGAKTAATGGVVVTPGGGGGTGGGTTNGGMTQIEVDATYFSALLAQIPGQIQAALDLAFADWSALGLSEEQIAKLRSVTDPLAQARDLYDGSFAGIDPLDIPQSAFDAIGKATEALTKVNDRLRALGMELPGLGADAAASGTILSDALAQQLRDAAANAMEWTRTRQELADYMNGARRGEVVSDTAKAEIRAAAENALEWVRNAQQLAEYMNGSRRGEAMSDTLRAELVASVQESMEWTRDRANLATYMAGQRRGEAVSEVIYAGLTSAVDAALAFGDVDALTQLAEQAQFTGIGSQVASFIGDQIKQMYRDTKDQIEGLLEGGTTTPAAVLEIRPAVNVDPASVEAAIAEALRGIPLQDIIDGAMPVAGVDLADLVRIKSTDLAESITAAVNEAFRNRKLKVPSSAVRTG